MSGGGGQSPDSLIGRFERMVLDETDSSGGTAGLMTQLQLYTGDTMMPPKSGPRGGSGPELATNVYKLGVDRSKRVLHYDFTIICTVAGPQGHPDRQIQISDKAKGDFITVERRGRCRCVFQTVKQNHDSFQKIRCAYYDLQSIVFSLDEIPMQGNSQLVFNVPLHALPPDFRRYKEVQCILKKGNPSMLSVLDQMSDNSLDMAGRELMLFFEIATSQDAMLNENEHITFSAQSSYLQENSYRKYGFNEDDVPVLPNNARLIPGAHKTARAFEGSPGQGAQVGIIVEAKKTPFHLKGNVLEKARSLVKGTLQHINQADLSALRSGLKGLCVQTLHTETKQIIFIKDVSHQNSQSTRFTNSNGAETTVAQHFQQRYGFRLQFPDAPVVVVKGRTGDKLYYPMEALEICPHQRVKGAQQTSQQTQQTIRKCAIPPIRLADHVRRTAESLHLFRSNELENSTITVDPQRLIVPSNVIEPPTIQYGNSQMMQVRTDSYTWAPRPNTHFHTPATINKWAAVSFVASIRQVEWENFLGRFIRAARDSGMTMAEPKLLPICPVEQMPKLFASIEKEGFEFLLALHSDQDKAVHEDLKYFELKHCIVTQAVRAMTMTNVVSKNQVQTMQNIIAKTNVKMGGMDYVLAQPRPQAFQLLGNGDLFIGISYSDPFAMMGGGGDTPAAPGEGAQPSALPSVVGYAANTGANNDFEFIGDFVFQTAQREVKATLIPLVLERCITRFRATCNNNPKRIIIYRNGFDEGHFHKIRLFDVPLAKFALKEMGCGDVPLTMLVVNKLQSIRFFKQNIRAQDRPTEQNIMPGTVVDRGVVHPCFQEFFLNSHRALQGTARTPKYTVLIDESRIPVGDLEVMSYQLCYGHQIVNMPTSLPSPLYIANRYAERGRKLYSALVRENRGRHDISIADLNHQLGYNRVQWLGDWRINA